MRLIHTFTILIVFTACQTAFATTMFFDFNTSSSTTAPNYNAFFVSSPGPETIPNAIDSTGTPTGIQVVRNGLYAANALGVGSQATAGIGDAAAIFHPDALIDGAYGHDNWGSRTPAPTGVFTFSGLDPSGNTLYDFSVFNSRIWTDGNTYNRDTFFEAVGANSGSTELEAFNNISDVSHITGIQPTSLGEIVLTVKKTGSNNSPEGFYVINAMRVQGHAVPEPGTFVLLGICAFGILLYRRR